jgi:uracil-DNA glycosylase family 4
VDPAARQAYLAAMGIQAWELRGCAAPGQPATPAANAASAPAAEPGTVPVAGLDWEALRERVEHCSLCELHATRTQTVFGVGDSAAQLMVVGEAPGADEDRQGEPFVGRAGKLLNEMLLAIGLKRPQVYIANILKCRPPNNRDPQPREVACCEPFLQRQVELVRPRVMLALGRVAAHNLLKTQDSLARLRGRDHRYGNGRIPVVVTYHPAYLLRSPQDKRKAWQDLLRARGLLAGARESL